MDELTPAEQAIGLDRAGVLIERHAGAILTRFAEGPLPEGLKDLLGDVEAEYLRLKEAK